MSLLPFDFEEMLLDNHIISMLNQVRELVRTIMLYIFPGKGRMTKCNSGQQEMRTNNRLWDY